MALGLQNLILQLVQQFLFDPVTPDQHRIGACAAIEVLRAPVLRIVPVRAVPGDDDQVPRRTPPHFRMPLRR